MTKPIAEHAEFIGTHGLEMGLAHNGCVGPTSLLTYLIWMPLFRAVALTLARLFVAKITISSTDNSHLPLGLNSCPETYRANPDSIFGDVVHDAAVQVGSVHDIVFFGISGCGEGRDNANRKESP
jgi:hypothetical protein